MVSGSCFSLPFSPGAQPMGPFVEGTVCTPGAHRAPPVWLRPEGRPTPYSWSEPASPEHGAVILWVADAMTTLS